MILDTIKAEGKFLYVNNLTNDEVIIEVSFNGIEVIDNFYLKITEMPNAYYLRDLCFPINPRKDLEALIERFRELGQIGRFRKMKQFDRDVYIDLYNLRKELNSI